jgi:hypothetical protein
MRNVQAPQVQKYSPGDAVIVMNENKLPTEIFWIMTATSLATFGILVAAYQLLF